MTEPLRDSGFRSRFHASDGREFGRELPRPPKVVKFRAPGMFEEKMEQGKTKTRPRLHLPYLILVCGLLATAIGTYLVQENFYYKNNQRFIEGIGQVDEIIGTRMEAYLGLLRGGAGLFAANEYVTLQQFQSFYKRLDIQKHYPGIQGFGYSVRFPASKLEGIISAARQQGATNFTVWPPNPRTEYHAIVFLEPEDEKNKKAIGFDMFTEPRRREAMMRATETGDAVASGRVTLVQESSGTPQPGFLIYVPVYLGGTLPATIEARRERLQGFVYTPFRAWDLFDAMFKGHAPASIDFRIYDSAQTTPANLLYQRGEMRSNPEFSDAHQISIAGRTWSLKYQSAPRFGFSGGGQFLILVPVLGVLGSLLLFYFTRAEGKSRWGFEKLSNELFDERERLEVTFASIADGVIATDTEGQVKFINSMAAQLTGWKAEEAEGKPLSAVFDIIQEESRQVLENPALKALAQGAPVNLPNHTILIGRDGTERCIDDSAAPIRDRNGEITGVVLVFREITKRRQYERRITAQHAVTAVLAGSPSLSDAAGQLLEVLCEHLKFEHGVFWMRDIEGNYLSAFHIWHSPNLPLEAFDQCCLKFHPKIDEGLPGAVWLALTPRWVDEFSEEPRFPRGEEARKHGIHSAFAFPIIAEDELLGVLEFFSRQKEKPDIELQNVALGIGRQIGQFIQRKNAEHALQQSEELYRAISETAADGILTIDEKSRILSINPAVEKIFGYSREELIGQDLRILMPERLRERHFEGIQHYVQTGQRRIGWSAVELSGLHKTGAEIALEISFGATRREDAFLFTGLIRDISKRKEADQRLREAEERFGLFVRLAEEYAIITMGPNARITTWNAGAQRIFGYAAEEIIGQPSSIFFTEEDQAKGLPEHEVQTAIREGQILNERWQVRKDSSHFWASGSLICLRTQTGAVRGFAMILRDVTERKKTEEAIRELNQELETRVMRRTSALQESKEQMEAFTYTVAHDLRAPLRAMQGFSHALMEDYQKALDENARDYLRRIMASAARMDELIQDLLAYSRLSRSDLSFQSVSLPDAIQSILEHLAHEIREHGAKVRVSVENLRVRAHPATFEHLLANLLTNAMKFSKNGQAPEIQIRAIDKGDSIRTMVKDNGIGIAPEHHERIFRVFERLHGSEDYPGTGIGLAIVKKGVERMGGSVGVDSEPGQGSTFWIELPKAEK
jgi:PAS domain S-box-containing protein